MNTPFLIDSVVRHTTVLIAQLATSGGIRAPLAQVANQVFLDLAGELERQGISRKVSADMFGLGLRTYLRKIQRLSESSTERGRSLWEAALACVQSSGVITRHAVLERFFRDDEVLVRGVLHDLCESGLIFSTGSGENTAYRASTEAERGQLRQLRSGEGVDELVWAVIYREGPVTREALSERGALPANVLASSLERLVLAGRVSVTEQGGKVSYGASEFVVPIGATVGWEAAVFDHFQAVVKTICCRLTAATNSAAPQDVGGSTYTFDVWQGHPYEAEVRGTLARLRDAFGELRQKVEAHNATCNLPDERTQTTIYVGQCVIPNETTGDDSNAL